MITEPVDVETRSSCLTLSVFSQAVVDALTRARDLDDHARQVLSDAIEILNGVSEGRVTGVVGAKLGLRPFRTYEQLTALYEVVGPDASMVQKSLGNLVSALQSALGGGGGEAQASPAQINEEALTVFRRLAKKAQEVSLRATERVPDRIVELCQRGWPS